LIEVGLVASAATTAAAAATMSATAAAAATVSTTAAATAAAAAATRAIFTRTRFVDGQGATIDIFAVKRFDRGVALGSVIHGDKSKSAGTSGFAILNYDCLHNGTKFGELFLQR
jgi:hypothetical protein